MAKGQAESDAKSNPKAEGYKKKTPLRRVEESFENF